MVDVTPTPASGFSLEIEAIEDVIALAHLLCATPPAHLAADVVEALAARPDHTFSLRIYSFADFVAFVAMLRGQPIDLAGLVAARDDLQQSRGTLHDALAARASGGTS